MRISTIFNLFFKWLLTSLTGGLHKFTQLAGISQIYKLHLLFIAAVWLSWFLAKKKSHSFCQSLYRTLNNSYCSFPEVTIICGIKKVKKGEKAIYNLFHIQFLSLQLWLTKFTIEGIFCFIAQYYNHIVFFNFRRHFNITFTIENALMTTKPTKVSPLISIGISLQIHMKRSILLMWQ